MKMWAIVRALGPIDAVSIRRDPMLKWLAVYPLFLCLLIRWGVPILKAYLMERFQFDLVPYYPLLMSCVILMTPMLAGIVIGFLLLDQRDDQTLTALQVTPLTLSGYFAYRIAVPTILSLVITIVAFPVTALTKLGFLELVGAGLSSCLLAPLYALFLGTFAGNKVQGFAITKGLGVLLVPPLIAYFVPPPWQFAFGIDPLYWPAKFLWGITAGAPGAWMHLLAGMLFQAILLQVLLRRA